MDERQIRVSLNRIRNGVDVLKNISKINEHISDLRYHAEYDKTLEPGIKKILHHDANRISKELFFASEAFINSGTSRFE